MPARGPKPRAVRTLCACAALSVLLLTGCQRAIVGHWRLHEALPNREVFAIDDATFRRDGTFAALTTTEGLTTRMSGEYAFNGYNLKLRPEAGGQRSYSAIIKMNRLELLDGQRKVILRKVKKDK